VGLLPKPALNTVTFAVHAGEIVGIAGVAGNGQAELVGVITGRCRVDGGTLTLSGTPLADLDTRARRELGMAIVPEDRHLVGSVARMPAFINMSMGKHRSKPLSAGGLIDRQAMREHARRLIDRFGVAIQGPDTKVGTLSGGNLQKLIVARELDHQAPFLLIEQPTRGVDVGAIEHIHKVLIEERTAGKAILLISSELPELLSLCDRILVLYEGEIIKALSASETDEKEIGFYMAGGKDAK
jgi:simple sugar transport system ATP-binding protein